MDGLSQDFDTLSAVMGFNPKGMFFVVLQLQSGPQLLSTMAQGSEVAFEYKKFSHWASWFAVYGGHVMSEL